MYHKDNFDEIPPLNHNKRRRLWLTLFGLGLIGLLLFSIIFTLKSIQSGQGLRKCRENEFVLDEDKPANKGFQASVAILRDPLTGKKYFFKGHKSQHVFKQERKILHNLGTATPEAVCYVTKPERGIVMELASGGDLYSDLWYRPDNPLRFESYHQLIHATAHFLASLAAVHAKGYLHNDLRPNNVIFSHPYRLQVIDFGLSRKLGKKGFHTSCSRNSPPETACLKIRQDRFQKINSTASDWYTFGVLTHYFIAKGLYCINTDNYWEEACDPRHTESFWPFRSRTFDPQTKAPIYEWNEIPVPLPASLKDFLSKLIVDDPLKRDFRGPRLLELKQHPIFSAINWDEL